MAKRRLQGALAGLGAGMTNVGDILLRTMMQDRLQSRYDKRAADNATAISGREETAANRRSALALMEKAATGDGDPEGVASMLSLLGINADPSQIPQPSPRRRLENTVGKSIGDAKNFEDVPTDQDIIGIAKSRGVNDTLSHDFLVPDATSDDPYAVSPPEVKELGARAAARRKVLDVPEMVDYTDPTTGAKGKRGLSKRDPSLAEGIALGPTAEQQGTWDADKARKEAEARQGVEMSPTAVTARVNESSRKASGDARAKFAAELAAGGITGQQQQAALALADDYQKQSAVFSATKQAVSSISTLAQRIEAQRKTGADSPAAHIGLIFNFMKMQDPGSTVREGEQAMASNAAGVDERVRNLYNSIVKGGKLSPEQVSDFVNTAASVYTQRAQAQKALEGDFAQRAATMRVPAPLVTGYVSMLANGPQTAADKLRDRR